MCVVCVCFPDGQPQASLGNSKEEKKHDVYSLFLHLFSSSYLHQYRFAEFLSINYFDGDLFAQHAVHAQLNETCNKIDLSLSLYDDSVHTCSFLFFF